MLLPPRVVSSHFLPLITFTRRSLSTILVAFLLLPMCFIRPFGHFFVRSLPIFPMLFLLFFARANPISAHQTSASPAPSLTSSGFWLSTELLSVTFHKGCLSTALCHQPAFKLVHTMTLNGQKSAMSWPVDGGGGGAEILQDRQLRQFVSHWTVGDPEDVSIACQIAGIDPSFGFARVCDETSARRVFQEAMVRRTVLQNNNNNGNTILRTKRKDGGGTVPPAVSPVAPSLATDNGQQQQYPQQMVVEMRGRCFNATLAVRSHLNRCPWCPDPNVHIHVVGADGNQQGVDGRGNDAQQQHQLNNADSLLLLHNIVILALSGAVVFAFTGLCAVFVAQRRHRRKKQHKTMGGGRRESGGKSGGGMSSTLMMMRGGRREKGKKRAKLLSPPRAQQSLPIPQQQNGEEEEQSQQQQQTKMAYGGESRRIAGGEEQEEEERYDTPWDNKYCLVPRQWLFDNNGSAYGGIAPMPSTGPLQPAESRATCIASQFRHPPAPLHRPTPYEHCAYSFGTSGKYATCGTFGGTVATAKSPMMGMLCSQNNSRNQSSFYGPMPTADYQQQKPKNGRTAISDQSLISARTAVAVPDQPPPPPLPPIALLSVRHAQPKLHQQHQGHENMENPTFSSPNTSSGSASRHDDSGLDSV